MKNTLENSKLIADFIGADLLKDLLSDNNGFININVDIYEQCKFHSDWNWLMEVVEKCLVGEAEYNEDEAKKAIREIYESLCNINISSVYNACVEFIKWYNEQNKK